MVDGAVVAVFVTQFYDDVMRLGLQYTPRTAGWAGRCGGGTDFIFYRLHWLMHKTAMPGARMRRTTAHCATNLSTALPRQNSCSDLSGLALLWWLPWP